MTPIALALATLLGLSPTALPGDPLPAGWPDSALHVKDDASAAQLRTRLIEQIWKCAGMPGRVADAVAIDVGADSLQSPVALQNIDRVDRYTIKSYGSTVRPWLIRPRLGNNVLALISLGHTQEGTLEGTSGSSLLVQEALRRGNTVLLVPMPDGAVPGHNLLGTHSSVVFSPLVYFLDPAIIALNTYLAENPKASAVVAMGISGGGWATTLLAALDVRIRSSFSVAGSLPLAVRLKDRSDFGDWEQRLPGLTYDGSAQLEYLDLYLMGVSDGRTQVQINNEFDSCCFAGRRHESYARTLAEVNPRWTFYLDSSHREHTVGNSRRSRIIGPALGPELPLPPPPFSLVIDDDDPGFAKTGPDWKRYAPYPRAYNSNKHSPSPASPACSSGGTGLHEATWTASGVPDAPLEVSVSWVEHSNRATDAPYEILDGTGNVLWSVRLNQRKAPQGRTIRGATFEPLAIVQTATGTLTVRLSDRANGCVVADAVSIIQVSRPE